MQPINKTGAWRRRQISTGMTTLVLVILLSCLVVVVGCRKTIGSPPNNLDLQLVADYFVSPVALLEAPDSTHRLFVVDQIGKVWILDTNGRRSSGPFIDISNKLVSLMPGYDERGLLGMAFHPEFKTNGKFYLFYTAPLPAARPSTDTNNTSPPPTWNNISRVSEFRVSTANSKRADINSERIILEEPHPQSNNNGGTIAFGPDGYLYISIGDGGNKNDLGPGHEEDWYATNAGGNGQDIEKNLMGNVLRIDVNGTRGGQNYGIPSDNPFVNKVGRDEIYAYGFRNPYRFSFDMGDLRELYVGDAGQDLYEEVDVVIKGGNYGWNVKEGTHCFDAANEFEELSNCPDTDAFGNPLIDPVIELRNYIGGGETRAVVGGYVYRGQNIPGLEGLYVFGNFSADNRSPMGQVFISVPGSLLEDWPFQQITFASYPDHLGHWLKGFGQDLSGELYVLASRTLGPSRNTGKVFKLVVTPGSSR